MKVTDSILYANAADAFFKVGGVRYQFELKNLEATVTKNNAEIAIMGKRMKAHKGTSMTGAGKASMYMTKSTFGAWMEAYKDTGSDVRFEVQGSNEDKTSTSGTQIVNLLDCLLDGDIPLFKFDSGEDFLEMDISFVFDDFTISKQFI